MQKRKLTFPPAVGTFESNQKRRAMLIAKQRAAQQSMRPTSGIRRGLLAWFWLLVLSALKHLSTPPTRG